MGGDQASKAAIPLPVSERVRHSLGPAVEYVAELAQDGTIVALSRPVLDYTIDQIVGTTIQRWVAEGARPALERALAEAFASGEPQSFAWIGAESGRSFESNVTPVWKDGAIVHVVLTTQDVTDSERQQQALRESEQRFHALVQGAFEGLAITVDGIIQVANEALGRMLRTSVDSLIGRSGYEFCAPESVAIAREAVRKGDEAPYEVVGVRPDGSRYPCEILGRNILYLGKPARLTGFRDLTERHRLERERKEIEEQMRHAQKLESLGMLAGGIAHDFNNVLMAVLANAEIALRSVKNHELTSAHLGNIQDAAMRGRLLTRQLLNYAAQGPLSRQSVDLNALVQSTLALLGVSISKKVNLVVRLADAPAVVEGDPGQLQQLLMNLVINASEALGDEVGQITLQTAHAQLAQKDLEGSLLLPDIPDGRAVMLRVSDTGQGMSEETKRRIYEPFFTTKLAGRGLGLATVLNVVRGHRGAIRLESELGAGTAFTVWLKQSEELPQKRISSPVPHAVRASRGLALVVDDEPMLRSTAQRCMESLGFEVIVAVDGDEALARFEAHRDTLRFVLLDLTMPKRSGVETLRQIRALNAELPVLCVSGYSSDLVASEIGSDRAARFLAKPYSLAELTSAIDDLVGQSAS